MTAYCPRTGISGNILSISIAQCRVHGDNFSQQMRWALYILQILLIQFLSQGRAKTLVELVDTMFYAKLIARCQHREPGEWQTYAHGVFSGTACTICRS